jgi:hypothetical protein
VGTGRALSLDIPIRSLANVRFSDEAPHRDGQPKKRYFFNLDGEEVHTDNSW